MSVVDRFKNRRLVSPVVEVEIAGVTLRIARISKLELEKAGKIARKEFRDEGLDPADANGLALNYARAAAVGAVLRDHIKGWNLTDVAFGKEPLAQFFQEMSYEERAELGLLYLKACEAKDDEEKKTYDALIQILRGASGNESDSTSSTPTSNAESAPNT